MRVLSFKTQILCELWAFLIQTCLKCLSVCFGEIWFDPLGLPGAYTFTPIETERYSLENSGIFHCTNKTFWTFFSLWTVIHISLSSELWLIIYEVMEMTSYVLFHCCPSLAATCRSMTLKVSVQTRLCLKGGISPIIMMHTRWQEECELEHVSNSEMN